VAYGRNTIPVVIGILTTKIVTICLIAITIAMLCLSWFFFVKDYVTLVYLSVFVVIPLIVVIYLVIRSTSRRQLHIASRLMKIIMLTGILYSVVVRVLVTYNLV